MKRRIRFAGSGGQGVILASVLLAKAYGLGKGMNISQTQSYGPEARGGACKAELVVSDRDIEYMKVGKADVFAAFNQAGYDKYIGEAKGGAAILVNSTLVDADMPGAFSLPATEIAESLGSPMSVNLVMLGALTRLLGDLEYEVALREVGRNFDEKYRSVNIAAFEKGYSHAEYLLSMAACGKVRKVMAFVTTQKNCERLIRCGKELAGKDGELSIVHIASGGFSSIGSAGDSEALDYLYESALKHEANLMVIRSDDVAGTIGGLVEKNAIEHVVLGESREAPSQGNMIVLMREQLRGKAELSVVPA